MVGNLYTLAPIKAVVLLDALINRKRSSCVTEKSVNDILIKLKIKLNLHANRTRKITYSVKIKLVINQLAEEVESTKFLY